MKIGPIDPSAWYQSDARELDVLGEKQTRARHRHEGIGSPYHKLGSRVVYFGGDVLDYLRRNRIATDGIRDPQDAEEAA